MELLSLLIRPGKNKICMLCYKECNNTQSIYNNMEIEGSISQNLNIAEIINYLFPSFDITLSQVCDICSDLLYKMYMKMKENRYRKKLLAIIITTLCNEINQYNNLKLENLNKVFLNVNLATILNPIKDSSIMFFEHNLSCDSNIDREIDSNSIENEFVNQSDKNNSALQKHCPHCPKTFDNAKLYKAHLKSHGRKQKHYYCNQCNYKSHCKLSVQGHKNKNHLKTRPYICQMCFKSFFHKKNLKEHMESHEQVHNEMCEVCGKRFLHKKNLDQHLKLHSGDRPFECQICSKRFVTSGRRLEHIKRIHMEKTENCLFCDKKFSLNKELTRHMKSVHATF